MAAAAPASKHGGGGHGSVHPMIKCSKSARRFRDVLLLAGALTHLEIPRWKENTQRCGRKWRLPPSTPSRHHAALIQREAEDRRTGRWSKGRREGEQSPGGRHPAWPLPLHSSLPPSVPGECFHPRIFHGGPFLIHSPLLCHNHSVTGGFSRKTDYSHCSLLFLLPLPGPRLCGPGSVWGGGGVLQACSTRWVQSSRLAEHSKTSKETLIGSFWVFFPP